MLDWLVGDGELCEVVANHIGLWEEETISQFGLGSKTSNIIALYIHHGSVTGNKTHPLKVTSSCRQHFTFAHLRHGVYEYTSGLCTRAFLSKQAI